MATERLMIVVMGVSGSGKSTVGAALAQRLGLPFVDGDSLHSAEAVAKMAGGTPLTDEDRWPWLDRIGARLGDRDLGPEGCVVACSALRRIYRDRIRAAAGPVVFVYLEGAREVIAGRQAARHGHYMPPSLMASQFATLEPPVGEPGVITVDVAQDVTAIVDRVARDLAPPNV